MFANEDYRHSLSEETMLLMELSEAAVRAQSFEELAKHALPTITKIMHSDVAFLYIEDAKLPSPCFLQYGCQPATTSEIAKLCAEQFKLISAQSDSKPLQETSSLAHMAQAHIMLYALQDGETRVGLIGLMAPKDLASTTPDSWDRVLRLMASTITRLLEQAKREGQLKHLNAYLTVSSLLAQSLDVHELLETALYCSMDAISAEAASVLLLDDEKKNFVFYQVEGPAKPILMTATFPANVGIAGSVLQTQQSEVINNVQSDPRFYQNIDSESGFQTRSLIAIPLTAGEEQIGVLEVLNKVGADCFTEDDRLLLLSIADEIAFAIRNARVFEYVVNTYCKQRQGQGSCKGCKRPLGSWTPCLKYREANS